MITLETKMKDIAERIGQLPVMGLIEAQQVIGLLGEIMEILHEILATSDRYNEHCKAVVTSTDGFSEDTIITLSEEETSHAQALENFRQAMIAAMDSKTPIDLDICLAAWDSIAFCYQEWQQIVKLADTHIEQLKGEIVFQSIEPGGTA